MSYVIGKSTTCPEFCNTYIGNMLIFAGIGWAVVLIAFYTDFFYNVIISWALYYFFASFTKHLPWTECGEWATENCFSGHMHGEKHPQCSFKDRMSVCADYMSCESSNLCAVGANFTYPVMDKAEATISSFKPIVSELFNTSYPYYDNVTGTVTLTAGFMQEYCEWKPNTTGPAAEYFQ